MRGHRLNAIRSIHVLSVLSAAVLFTAVAGLGPVAADTAPTASFDAAVERYRTQLVADVDGSIASVEKLRDSVAGGDLALAKQAWIEARVGWERAEVFTSGFAPELDRDIDAWPNGPTGFHAIEVTLFSAGRADVSPQIDALLRDLTAMAAKARQTRLTPQGLLDGLSRLAYEVGESKLDGGESRVSGTSLNDIRHNVEGIEQAYTTIFAGAIESRDPKLDGTVHGRIDELKRMLVASDLRQIDQDRLRIVSEELVMTLQAAAPEIGLTPPTLELQ
ncbi:EfeM/EfeO family lipoprotein [Bradyrhizobium sp. HKCCYLS1011]|uniref:EfeM/EfeO family lipoprotein n=1 Tax=Bradyrhizobium sp. HKCCYLS1011 TaxID=3420733 RepID=UPI003EBA454B